MVVHFPVALLITGFLFATLAMLLCKKSENNEQQCNSKTECAKKRCCIQNIGYYLLILGTLGAAAAFITGSLFATLQSPIRPVHSNLAFWTLCFAVVTSVVSTLYQYKYTQSKILKNISYILYLLVAILVGITGHYGGLIVY